MAAMVGLHLPRPAPGGDIHQAARRLAVRDLGSDGLDVLGHHGGGIAPGAVAQRLGAFLVLTRSRGIGALLGGGPAATGGAKFGDGRRPGGVGAAVIDADTDLVARQASEALGPFGDEVVMAGQLGGLAPSAWPDVGKPSQQGRRPLHRKPVVHDGATRR